MGVLRRARKAAPRSESLPFRKPLTDVSLNLVTHLELAHPLLFGSRGRGWVTERPMQTLAHTRQGTGEAHLGASTDRDHVIELDFAQIIAQRLGVLSGDVNANLLRGAHGVRIDYWWVKAGAVRLEAGTSIPAQKNFRHLASSRVARAVEQRLYLAHDQAPRISRPSGHQSADASGVAEVCGLAGPGSIVRYPADVDQTSTPLGMHGGTTTGPGLLFRYDPVQD
jgi:hypothetical protein